MTNKQKLDYWVAIVFGAIMTFPIFLIIDPWLITEDLPSDLTVTVGEFSSLGFYIQLCLFLWFTSVFIFYTHELHKKFRGIETPPPFFMYLLTPKLIDILQNYVLSAPWVLWKYILYNVNPRDLVKYMKLPKEIFIRIEGYLYDRETDDYIEKKIITWVSLVYLPKLIVFTVLLYEVAINKYILSFYGILIILLVPMIMYAIRRILFDFGLHYTNFLLNNDILIILSQTEVKPDLWHFVFKSDLTEEEGLPFAYDYCDWKGLFHSAQRFTLIDEKYSLYSKLMTYFLLSLSFGLMLLIRLGLY